MVEREPLTARCPHEQPVCLSRVDEPSRHQRKASRDDAA
jgi:hypothetical protein